VIIIISNLINFGILKKGNFMSSYDRKTAGTGPATFGYDGEMIDLSSEDYTVPETVKAIMVIASGDVVCRPLYANADITITDAPIGLLLPWHCEKITQTGTTATLATVIG
jgi:hypothetical protein